MNLLFIAQVSLFAEIRSCMPDPIRISVSCIFGELEVDASGLSLASTIASCHGYLLHDSVQQSVPTRELCLDIELLQEIDG